ncbi:MAG: transketolase [Desulfobacterales bacterium]|jgi:transketolase|nr:transketolase [Desulfobacterales bacterium]
MASQEQLRTMADKLRIHSLRMTTTAGSGHPTTCLSAAEIMSVLFFSVLEPHDEFILSKGHAAPILWAAFAEAGLVALDELPNLRRIDSALEGHPTSRMPLIKVASGSLGQGLSAGVGMALAKKLDHASGCIFVLQGDGETAEGSVWEAADCAAAHGLDNLVLIIDANRLGQSGPTRHGHDLAAFERKFSAFGWDAAVVDGHDVGELARALARTNAAGRPLAVIARTFKGKGVSFMEDKEGWHGKPLSGMELQAALGEIGPAEVSLSSRYAPVRPSFRFADFPCNEYAKGEMVSTRAAFGKGLLNLGGHDDRAVAIDGDVKNSTMAEDFFKAYPERSFETHIAEQNMAGMAMGFSAMGHVPYVATFAAFLTRAHDFVRMAQYSGANIKFVGSHAGVSIGADGPSQMGLEDLAMFLAMPEAMVLYPSDAVATGKLLREMARHQGISYLRTTRDKTPVLYGNEEEFPAGGLKVLRSSASDRALIAAAGITLHEALRAHDILRGQGIAARVIDLYSLQPFPAAELARHARACGGRVVVVEDHYGGAIAGLAARAVGCVTSLHVQQLPRSGSSAELLALMKIDSTAIAQAVKELLSDK